MMKTRVSLTLFALLLWSCSEDAQSPSSKNASSFSNDFALPETGALDEARRDEKGETLIPQDLSSRGGALVGGGTRIAQSEDGSTSLLSREFEHLFLLSDGDPSSSREGLVSAHIMGIRSETGTTIACVGGGDMYNFRLDSFEIADERVARVKRHDDDSVTLLAGEVGTTTLTLRGDLSYKRESIYDMSQIGPDPRCMRLWDGALPMEVHATVEVLPSSARSPYPRLVFRKLDECEEGAQTPLAILEGGQASIDYDLRAGAPPRDWNIPANWMHSDAMVLRSSVGGPAFAVENNSAGLVSLRHLSGTGRATLVSPRGPTQAIEVASMSDIAEIDALFFAGATLYGPKDPVWGHVDIGQGVIALRSGSVICDELLEVEARSLTPETCSVGDSYFTRPSHRPTGHGIEFNAPGRCEIELSWPGTDLVQRYSFTAVEPPER